MEKFEPFSGKALLANFENNKSMVFLIKITLKFELKKLISDDFFSFLINRVRFIEN